MLIFTIRITLPLLSPSMIVVVTSAPTKDILDEVGTEEQVIAVGGGAVIDTAKILSKNPIMCYPTTAAGSSSTSWSVYWDGTKKCSIKRMLPKDVMLNGLFIEDLSDPKSSK